MDIEFLGGVNKVGSLGMLLGVEGHMFLFDYGLTPSDPPEYPVKSPFVDMAFLSHSHIDHSGMMPWLAGRRRTPILTTPVTMDVSELLARDNLKICDIEGYPRPFSKRDIKSMKETYREINHGDSVEIQNVDVEVYNAGHIPGASMFRVDDGSEKLLFTGDMNTIDTQLVKGADPVDSDIAVVEATYAGREHENREETEKRLIDTIVDTISAGGKVILPAFAVGRTQELLLLLYNHGYSLWLDGMGKKVTDIYIKHPSYVKSSKRLKDALNSTNLVTSIDKRRKAIKEADIIITTSGMMDGGPVLEYAKSIRDDNRSAILLVGYQVEGTNGRDYREKGVLNIDGVLQKLKCKSDFFDLSAHAGQKELIDFIDSSHPKDVILFHSEERELLAEKLKDRYNVHTPDVGERLKF